MQEVYRSAFFNSVKPADPFFAPRIKKCLEVTIPTAMRQCVDTGRIDAFKLNWKPGMPNQPHVFWDSDVAKVMEGMAYSLALKPDAGLERVYDEWVDLVVSAQQPDGYLNTHFTTVEPDGRWKCLAMQHELYCAGHLIEAAVAGYEALGKRKLLDCLCRYADYIDSVFGLEPGKRRGWPGHEEIELALVRLYGATGCERYLKLAAYFINDRGVAPRLFENKFDPGNKQADRPVREQTDAYGHAVRAVYLYTGMADVARETGDGELMKACLRLFDSIRFRRMYITGGIGSTFMGEAFTEDYELPNGVSMYAESCAAMGLVQLADRLFNATGDAAILDVLERTLYNGALSGISLSGDRFFYSNFLEVDDNHHCFNAGYRTRQPWFACSCCPTSYARFLPQIGRFLWSVRGDEIFLKIPAAGHAELNFDDGRSVSLRVEGGYPYDGQVRIVVETGGEFTLNCRRPGWCHGFKASFEGRAVALPLRRNWQAGDTVTVNIDMPVEIMHGNPRITADLGRAALTRGPLVYAVEERDLAFPVRELRLPSGAGIQLAEASDLPPGTVVLEGEAVRESFAGDALYTAAAPLRTGAHFRAVPYALWQNRGDTNMAVWLPTV
ncbi:MAG: glycoside hydrolase family 127 protein [Victivallaceae bacterium]|nr:glycoside hydrolase family 127 protein [Victivallaceae bacterium]